MRIVIKGAGDLASGIGWRLKRSGHEVWMTDLEIPTAVRRTVAFSRAVYENAVEIEGVKAQRVSSRDEGECVIKEGGIPVLVDPNAQIIQQIQPDAVVDAIIAKKNLGTKITDAPLVIGVGPGFLAGVDCHKVVETKRGHYLGKVIDEGSAIPNTGIPGDIGGYTVERIIRAASDGLFKPVAAIGDMVNLGQVVAYSGDDPIYAKMSGIVRGMLQENVHVTKDMKVGDIDARCEIQHCFTISDKARAIGGGVLEAVSAFEHTR